MADFMTDDELLAAAAPLLRHLLERDLLRVRLDSDSDTFTVLIAEPGDEDLAEQVRALLPLPPVPRLIEDTKH
jgi:hypothetical protein